MNLSLFIAWRYYRSKSADRFGQLVGTLASFGIILGVMALIIVLSVMNGLENTQKQHLLTGLPQAIIEPVSPPWHKSDRLSLPPIVTHSVPINRTNVIIQSQQAIEAGVLIGVEHSTDAPQLEPLNIDQQLPEGKFNLLINTALADKMGVNIGDKIRLMITENSQYTPFGRVPVQRLFTISGYYTSQDANDPALFANLNDVGRLLRLNEGEVQGVRLFLDDPFKVTELAQSYPSDKWQIHDWREQKGEFFQAVRMEKNMMGLLISLIIIVAISNIVTSLSLMVVDKQGEIAILQTQGLTKAQIMRVFMWQGAFVGIAGTLLGGGLGLLIASYLTELMGQFAPQSIPLPTTIITSQVVMIILGSMLLSLTCTLYPAYRATQVEPATALRYE